MAKIWDFFENMNEIVYVSDMDTYEVIYMNKKALSAYGFASVNEIKGRMCYEVLQGSASPCAVCTNSSLKDGEFMEWRFFNTRLGKIFGLKETLIMDGTRRCRMSIAFDASRINEKTDDKYNYSNLETLVSEAIRVAMRASTPDNTISVLIENIGKIFNSDRVYIFEQNKYGNDDNTYEWVASGVTPEKENLQDVPAEVCAGWYRNFSDGKSILIQDIEEIKDVWPQTYEVLKPQNITSLAVVPLYDNQNKPFGFYGADNPKGDSLENISNMLQIMANFIVSTMKVRNLVRELYVKSHTDQLTGLGNRHSMDDYISYIAHGESVGMVYCDITGLKQVNDTRGHKEGDELILRACSCLRDCFEEYGLFRIGGDELLAICRGISEKELDEKLEKLQATMESRSIVMAVGSVWQEGSGINLDEILTVSESRMRAKKEEYYLSTGIERRKY